MGHALIHWLVPGWTQNVKSLAPSVAQPTYVQSMLAAGEDPKSLVLEECKPQCHMWKDKLSRCEKQLEKIIKINPTKTCLYPMRDYVTCVEACTQPLIHNQLKGTH